jgi:hypothetical protein
VGPPLTAGRNHGPNFAAHFGCQDPAPRPGYPTHVFMPRHWFQKLRPRLGNDPRSPIPCGYLTAAQMVPTMLDGVLTRCVRDDVQISRARCSLCIVRGLGSHGWPFVFGKCFSNIEFRGFLLRCQRVRRPNREAACRHFRVPALRAAAVNLVQCRCGLSDSNDMTCWCCAT